MAAPREPRAWQRMLSGRRLDLADPSPLDVEIEDIAHGLARTARWNGQTRGEHIFSVAQHTLLVEALLDGDMPPSPHLRLAALLHDAAEYVIGDLISPFKAMLSADYKAAEARILVAVHRRFGLPEALPAADKRAIKEADRAAAFLEAVNLAGFSLEEARRHFPRPRITRRVEEAYLVAWPAGEATRRYLARFAEVTTALAESEAPAR
jgi:5'-deoxynucleotidase YfbR-like HD superfamily hydrolase